MPNEVAHARSMTTDGLYSSVAKLVSKTWKPVVTFVGLNLLITLAFLSLSPSSSHIGTLRPESTIAPKLLELALVGLGVGLVASLGFRSLNLSLITLGIAKRKRGKDCEFSCIYRHMGEECRRSDDRNF